MESSTSRSTDPSRRPSNATEPELAGLIHLPEPPGFKRTHLRTETGIVWDVDMDQEELVEAFFQHLRDLKQDPLKPFSFRGCRYGEQVTLTPYGAGTVVSIGPHYVPDVRPEQKTIEVPALGTVHALSREQRRRRR